MGNAVNAGYMPKAEEPLMSCEININILGKGPSINDVRFFGVIFDPLPSISDFLPILKALLHKDSPIFENLLPLPKIGYHLWTEP